MAKVARADYRIIYADTDCGGVVYYANYFRLFEIGRTELLRQAGLTYRDIEEKEGIILPVVEARARYRHPARYDDLITIETTFAELFPHKVRFEYKIWHEKRLLVEGFTVHVPVNKEGRLVKFPEKLYSLLKKIF
ncbi:acyl-CoA thioesterase [Thermodesulfatator autotrophicus]|uniref:Thioesterase n=1 Tax=Thermodesulfatator autotrophicus TaxID=1795632 RepID=A0A177E487_9BACT|nr:thioesterase family protein [Thermodesulfatator autotrophicus]OAG26735.1 thioesterase [Thermodesulfatator autotrophicus]